jgi:hypothetical protein
LSFDAAKLIWGRGRRVVLEAAGGRPLDPRKGVFASRTSDREWFWYGALARGPSGPRRPSVELFYVGHALEGAIYGRGVADETRHSLGGRVWGRPAPLDYSIQASYQAGSFGAADIRAWGVATETGCSIASWPARPRVALRADIASGDRGHPGTLSTFNAPYPALNYFSEAAVFAPGNGFDLHPYLETRPLRSLSASGGVDLLWRLRRTDAVYRTGGGLLVRPGTSDDHFVTAIAQVDGTWQPVPQAAFRAAWVWATAGPVIRAAGGRSINFLLFSLDLKL